MISAIVITYNEEDVIEDCLESLRDFAGEIIVVDSYSSDKTQSLAKTHGAKVLEHDLISFSEQRNFALKHAKYDFVFYIDADERITSEFKKEALALVASYNPESDVAGYFIKRKTYYFGRDWGLFDSVQRLFFKPKFIEWFGVVHESPRVHGRFENINSAILHFTHRNLEQMIKKTNKWSDYEAKLRFDANHPKMTWWRFPRVMLSEFFKSFFFQNGFRNGTYGIIESIYQSYSIFITYSKLWELQIKSKKTRN